MRRRALVLIVPELIAILCDYHVHRGPTSLGCDLSFGAFFLRYVPTVSSSRDQVPLHNFSEISEASEA